MLEEIGSYIKSIKTKKLKPIYFLYGNENYFIESIIECIEQRVFANETAKNTTFFHASNDSWQQIILHAKQYSLFGDLKLIIVNNAQNRNFNKQNRDLQILQEYIQDPAPKTILIIAYKEQKLSLSKPILKILEQKSYIFKLSKLSIVELHKFITQYLAKRQLIIENEAIDFIIFNTGDNLSIIVKELDKIILNSKKGIKITVQQLSNTVTNSQNFNVFDFSKLIVTKDIPKAFLMLNEYSLGKDLNFISVISVLYLEFTKLLVAKAGSLDNINNHIPYYIQKFYKSHANKYSHDKLIEIIHLLRSYDLKIKYAIDDAAKLAYLYELVNFISIARSNTNTFS